MTTAVVFGYQAFGICGLEALERAGIRILRVYTHSDRPGEVIWWRSSAAWAAERGIPVEIDVDLKERRWDAVMAADAPELILSCYYRTMIPMRLLAAPLGAWNLHGSLLPAYRGRSPVNWQLLHGERRSGISLHRMLAKPDAGELLAQRAVSVHPDQDALGLNRQLLAVVPEMLDVALGELISGRAKPWLQDESTASYFGGRCPEDGRFAWEWPARRIHDLVRAVAPPWPGAFIDLAQGRLQVHRTAVEDDDGVVAAPGTVLADGGIACGRGVLHLLACGLGTAFTPIEPVVGSRLV